MPAQTDARDEALRCAREAARVVLAKHPSVVAGQAAQAVPARLEQGDAMGARNVALALSQ